jgi:hypothetical protein
MEMRIMEEKMEAQAEDNTSYMAMRKCRRYLFDFGSSKEH